MGSALLKGTILGAIIVFVWMMVSWMVIPWHCSSLNKFLSEDQVASVIIENTEHNGIYMLPNQCNNGDSTKKAESMQKGPIVFASVQRYGLDVYSVVPYIISFIIQLIAAFFVTYLVLLSNIQNYWKKVWFIIIFGIAVGVLASFPNWNWWRFSLSYVGVEFLDFVISWFLAGLVIAAVTKTKTA